MRRTTLKITQRESQAAEDLRFWRARPVQERLAAVEMLRLQHEGLAGTSADAQPRLQRVCRVAQRSMNFIGLEDFKANKRASGRHKDLADLESLED